MSTTPTPCATAPLLAPSAFSLTAARFCATLVEAAYDQFQQWVAQKYPDQGGFDWSTSDTTVYPASLTYSSVLWGNAQVLGVDNWEPFGFVAWDGGGNAYVVYRGTMTKADDYKDAEVAQTAYTLVQSPSFGNVHVGFFDIYQTLSPPTLQALGSAQSAAQITTLWFTGHSLGSGLVTLAMPDAIVNFAQQLAQPPATVMYNFASPRVGDVQFACSTNGSLGAQGLFRVVNTEDIVPTAPPAASDTSTFYEHVGAQVTFTAQYLSITGNHSMANCYRYAVENPSNPQGPLTAPVNFVTGFANGMPAAPIPAAPAGAIRVPKVVAG